MNPEALENLISMLDIHQPADEKENADVLLIRQMAWTTPEIFSRTNYPGHITGSALVVDLQGCRVLLHFHKSLERWLQLGGHANAGETDPAIVAMREAREESGLNDLTFFPKGLIPRPVDIDIHAIPARKGQPDHLHLDIRYLLVTKRPNEVAASDRESSQFMWLMLDKLETIEHKVDPSLLRFLHKVRRIFPT